MKIKKKAKKTNVPVLDFTRVYEIQQEQNMEYEEEEEEDEEEQEYGIINILYSDHSHLSESAKRQIELQSRKDQIIAILNNQHENKEEEDIHESSPESEDSPRTRLRKKLGADKKVSTHFLI